jgi:hypothetical protein
MYAVVSMNETLFNSFTYTRELLSLWKFTRLDG